VISIIMISSTAYAGTFVLTRKIIVQLIAYVLGFGILSVILLMDYKMFENMEKVIYVGSLLFLLTVYTPLGDNQYGAQG
jgi:rod shape determining protein RodA